MVKTGKIPANEAIEPGIIYMPRCKRDLPGGPSYRLVARIRLAIYTLLDTWRSLNTRIVTQRSQLRIPHIFPSAGTNPVTGYTQINRPSR